jgi:hypothetical protein
MPIFCSLWGRGALSFSHPTFWLWNSLVFWFRRFFCLRWDGESDFFGGKLCWMGGMGCDSMLDSQNVVVDFSLASCFRSG